MPTSNLQLAPRLLHLIWEVRPKTRPLRLLDYGPGLGKYGLLVREYVDRKATVDAIEAEPLYVTDRLRAIYDSISITGQPTMSWGWYDVVLMVDVIEHLDKPDALALLDQIPGYVVICTPREWFQNPEAEQWPTEEHRSHWLLEDFTQLARFDYYDPDAYDHSGAIIVRLQPRR